MKKGILIAIAVMLFAMSAIAQETINPRVSELANEYQQLAQQRQDLQQKLSGIDMRMIEIRGAVKELQREVE